MSASPVIAKLSLAVVALAGLLAGCESDKAMPSTEGQVPTARQSKNAEGKASGTFVRAVTERSSMKVDKATFAAGCFWGVEATFRKVPGVVDAAVGYAGGATKNPSYQDVCTDATGHAECVLVEFDPSKVTYDQLLDVFWACHDPTTPNRQGPDVGSQYRSAIFYHNEQQAVAARACKERLEKSGKFERPIVTEIAPAGDFYRAEEYHQRYLEKHGRDFCPSSSGR